MIQPKRVFTVTLAALTIGLVTLAGSTASSQAQPPARQPEGKQPADGRQPGRPGEGRGQQQAPSVEGSMKAMNRAMKQLADQIGDKSKKEENLRLVGDMERGCAGAKNGQANKIREIKDETERAKASVEFRKHLIEVMRKLLDVEESIMADKLDVAKTQLEAVAKMRDAGHKELGIDQD